MTIARLLIIAGSDSGGGAGIQADIKTVTMLGGHAMTAITAITAQNTTGVQGVMPVPPEMVRQQMTSCIDDIGVDAVKIGMIGSAAIAEAVAEVLAGIDAPVVLDPVMVATSGSVLADAATVAALERLMARAAVVTPNLPELEALGGLERLQGQDVTVLVKGGHAEGETITDRLVSPDGEVARWSASRIDTPHTHGTGCTLASGVATGLAQGMSLVDAIARARRFVRLSLLEAPGLGQGHGPMGQGRVREDAMLAGPALNQVMLSAPDRAASIAFYRRLGLTLIVDSASNGYTRFEAPNGVTLSLHPGSGGGEAVVYLESDRLQPWCAELMAAGVVFDQLPREEPWGWTEARLRDPAGNTLCLYAAGEMRRFPPWRVP